MEQVRPRLEAFAARMLGGLARADQRAKGELYLRGLMLDGRRKPVQPMAGRLGVDHQQLQQFVSSSTWDYVGVRWRVARWAEDFIAPQAYVIDDTGFPKDGADSPGVARMYSGTLGKTGNCQIGVSVHAVTDTASAAINWALFLPKSWDDTTYLMVIGSQKPGGGGSTRVAQFRLSTPSKSLPGQVLLCVGVQPVSADFHAASLTPGAMGRTAARARTGHPPYRLGA